MVGMLWKISAHHKYPISFAQELIRHNAKILFLVFFFLLRLNKWPSFKGIGLFPVDATFSDQSLFQMLASRPSSFMSIQLCLKKSQDDLS